MSYRFISNHIYITIEDITFFYILLLFFCLYTSIYTYKYKDKISPTHMTTIEKMIEKRQNIIKY